VAETERSPVILGALEPDIAGAGLEYWFAAAKLAAEKASTPVCIHLDHAVAMAQIKRVVDIGFSSVMLDASAEEFEENIRRTKEACLAVRKLGVSVEAELGHVGDGIAGSGESAAAGHQGTEGTLTEPAKVAEFVERTGVDALAVAIGTAHGVYITAPELDIPRMKRINELSPVPLVLHGGSGTPEDQLRNAIANGISKINIYSELLHAWNSAMLKTLKSLKNLSAWPSAVQLGPDAAMRQAILDKIALFGSKGKA